MLDMIRGRTGQYRLADLLMRYRRNEKVFSFTDDLTANCVRRQSRGNKDRATLSPDLPEVL